MATAKVVTVTGLNADITDVMVQRAFISKYKAAQVDIGSYTRKGTSAILNVSMGLKDVFILDEISYNELAK